MKKDHQHCRDGRDHDEILRHVQSPVLVFDVVQDNVRQGLDVRHPLVGEGEAAGGADEADHQEQPGQAGLEQLVGVVEGGPRVVEWNVESDGGSSITAHLSAGILPFF